MNLHSRIVFEHPLVVRKVLTVEGKEHTYEPPLLVDELTVYDDGSYVFKDIKQMLDTEHSIDAARSLKGLQPRGCEAIVTGPFRGQLGFYFVALARSLVIN